MNFQFSVFKQISNGKQGAGTIFNFQFSIFNEFSIFSFQTNFKRETGSGGNFQFSVFNFQ